jgi:predicted  nucleic acid-binding Zn-ribbon protein
VSISTALKKAVNWLKNKKKQITDGVSKIRENVEKAEDLAGEVKSEIKSTAKAVEKKVSVQNPIK